MKQCDVAVIGGGPGGYAAAIRAGQLGLKTVLIEKEAVGGVCLNVGCIPTKAFAKCAAAVTTLKKMEDWGVSAALQGVDLKSFQRKKRGIVERLTGGVGFLLKSAGVEIIRGEARFVDRETLEVKTGGGRLQVKARDYILAVGTRPRGLDILPLDGQSVVSSTEALSWDTLPRQMAVIGAGVVGMEFASIFSRLGVDVTVIEALPRILPAEDADVTAHLQKSMEQQGVVFRTGARLLSASRRAGGIVLEIECSGARETVTVQRVLVAAGRQSNVDTLALAHTGVRTDRGYIPTDCGMRTNVPHFYAVGDVVPNWQLAHVAYEEGYTAAENIAGMNKQVSYDAVPRCIYTAPEISSVGLTEAQARQRYGERVAVYTFPFRAVGKALIESDGDGFAKLIADKKYGEIWGCAMTGAGVGELIASAAVAMGLEGSVDALSDVIIPHPSLSEIVKEIALMADGRPLHMNKPQKN